MKLSSLFEVDCYSNDARELDVRFQTVPFILHEKIIESITFNPISNTKFIYFVRSSDVDVYKEDNGDVVICMNSCGIKEEDLYLNRIYRYIRNKCIQQS